MIRTLWRVVPRSAVRRLAGWTWMGAWCVALYAFARPWNDLGGWVDERTRWSAWSALLWGATAGFAIGRLGRRASVETGKVTHALLLRSVLVPVAAAVAAALVVLRRIGLDDPAAATVLGLLAYWAGIDIAYGAVPLMDGEAYALVRPLPPPSHDARGDADPLL